MEMSRWSTTVASATLRFGSCGVFIDSVLTTSAVVCQDPTSNKVAIVYFQPRRSPYYSGSIVDNDVVYRQSTDRGITWGPAINVTNYQNSDKERGYNDLTAMYTTQSVLHIAWTTPYYDCMTQAYTNQKCKLRHWDWVNNFITTVAYADNIQACIPGAGMANISKPCLSECDNKLYSLTPVSRRSRFRYPDCSAAVSPTVNSLCRF
jgi:hypothetical protein